MMKVRSHFLEELQQTYPGADIFLNGELTVDFPEDVKIPTEPNQMTTVLISGNSIKFSYCGLERAMPKALRSRPRI